VIDTDSQGNDFVLFPACDYQLGRDGASEAKPDQISGGDLDDHASKSAPKHILMVICIWLLQQLIFCHTCLLFENSFYGTN